MRQGCRDPPPPKNEYPRIPAGRTTGVVLESGDMQTHVAPVWEGYALPHRFRSLPIAGCVAVPPNEGSPRGGTDVFRAGVILGYFEAFSFNC